MPCDAKALTLDMSRANQLAARREFHFRGKTMKAQQSHKSPLPALTPIEGLNVEEPLNLLRPEERRSLKRELDEMARSRREAEANSHTLRLS